MSTKKTKISFSEYKQLILDPYSSEQEIRKYSTIIKGNGAFDWKLSPNPDWVEITPSLDDQESVMLFANGIAKYKRKIFFKIRKDNGSKKPLLVSEGDSWFQFPLIINDVIDHLNKDYLIWSVGSAGDTAKNMLLNDSKLEYLDGLKKFKGDVKAFLLSAAGNDIIGEDPESGVSSLQEILYPYNNTENVESHINFNVLNERLDFLRNAYAKTISNVRNIDGLENLPIILHGYDYVMPYPFGENDQRSPIYAKKDEWLGEAFSNKNITDKNLRFEIIKKLIDELYKMLETLSLNPDETKIWVVNNRNTLTDLSDWNDEIHGTSEGFQKIANNFKKILRSAIPLGVKE